MDHRPNTELTGDEKCAKRELKKLLKLQHQRFKLETRMKQAVMRRDHGIVERTLRDLEALALEEEREGVVVAPTIKQDEDDAQQLQAARSYVEAIYRQLQKSWSLDDQDWSKFDRQDDETTDKSNHEARRQRNRGNPQYTDRTTRERRIQKARVLLQNMTKGTQSIAMFDSAEALRGYTRHKFMERAVLVASSFGKLQQLSEQGETTSGVVATAAAAAAMLQRLWKVQTLCSIGCGPGCDAVGVLAFLQSISRSFNNEPDDSREKDAPTVLLDRVVLLDWAMLQWQPIVQTLKNLLIQQAVRQVDMATCDVRASLFKQHDNVLATEVENGKSSTMVARGDLLSLLTRSMPAEDDSSCSVNPCSSKDDEFPTRCCLNIDLIVVSYLLSETRGQWQHLMDDIVTLSVPGTLFLLTDPTAWQMHIFRERYEFASSDNNGNRQKQMDFVWLDSSMYRPELQVLEGRNGPAVLLAIKLC